MPKNTDITSTVGRRKTARATVRIMPAKERSLMVNGKTPIEYFKTEDRVRVALEAFETPEVVGMYSVRAYASGGGLAAQAGAVRHAIARALILTETITRGSLKKAGLLTRDPRAKERKKPGLKKARKAPQWSKR